MKKKVLTARQVREGKFLLRAPLVVIPLLILIFWGLGGGKSQAASGRRVAAKGFNMRVPVAHVTSIVRLNKMDYYEKARRDSASERQKERMEHSYAKVLGLDSAVSVVRKKLAGVTSVLGVAVAAARSSGAAASRRSSPERTSGRSSRASSVAASSERFSRGSSRAISGAISGVFSRPISAPRFSAVGRAYASEAGSGYTSADSRAYGSSPDLARLEKMVRVLQQDEGGNSEIAGLTAVLDKLTALQAPRRDSSQVHTGQEVRRAVFTVKALPYDDNSTAMMGAAERVDSARGFDSAAIEAIVPVDETLVSGGEVRLELVRDVLIAGRRIPAGSSLYGLATLSGERLRVTISGIAWQDRVYPVNLQVADEDGLPGIYIPGASMTDAVRESAGASLGSVGPSAVGVGLAGQAVDAGVSIGRQLIGKKIRAVRVTIPAGYRVLLHPQNYGL